MALDRLYPCSRRSVLSEVGCLRTFGDAIRRAAAPPHPSSPTNKIRESEHDSRHHQPNYHEGDEPQWGRSLRASAHFSYLPSILRHQGLASLRTPS